MILAFAWLALDERVGLECEVAVRVPRGVQELPGLPLAGRSRSGRIEFRYLPNRRDVPVGPGASVAPALLAVRLERAVAGLPVEAFLADAEKRLTDLDERLQAPLDDALKVGKRPCRLHGGHR
jgi:hypothetical protein